MPSSSPMIPRGGKVDVRQFLEENLKTVHEFGDVNLESTESATNLHVLCGSLVERYKRNQIALHLHLLGSVDSSDTCIVCQFGQVTTPGLNPSIPRIEHPLNGEGTEFCEQQSSVLIDVCEF